MAEDWGTTVIYAYAPPGGVGYDTGFTSAVEQLPDVIQQFRWMPEGWVRKGTPNGENVWNAVALNDTLATIDAVFTGLSGQSGDVIRQQLYNFSLLNRFLLKDPSESGISYDASNNQVTELEYGRMLYMSKEPLIDTGYDFFGNPTMPIAGVYYWLFGGGENRQVNIESLNLQMLRTDFQTLNDKLNPANNGGESLSAGVYNLSDHFEYSTYSHLPTGDVYASGLLGRINGNFSGELTVQQNGDYVFSGKYSINNDVYDANVGNRTFLQEAGTTFLRGLGEMFGHQDYVIEIIGEQPVTLTGNINQEFPH